MRLFGTFSLVARDAQTGDLGIAVASKFLAVGAVVPWARAGVGAVATQSYANPAFGPLGLTLMEAGAGPEDILAVFARNDPGLAKRQFGLVLASGESLSYTGSECHPWAGGRWGPNYAAQGNLLTGPEVVEALVQTFLNRADLPFPERLWAALEGADRAGGDKRGRQSAALLVVGQGKGYGGMERWIDLRVDDHPDPVGELGRLLRMHRLLFDRGEARLLETGEIAWLQSLLRSQGHYAAEVTGQWDEATEQALWALLGTENLEQRYQGGPALDEATLRYLRERFA
ncbi:MAG: DUF1028 domain-containing protein [Meiothermus sp.]|uniref:DUF1028 domain-containing protein n=1 Tax=Meiothermus sp. TaxID=1955249 RepID=UPI0025E37756|nr:DUF1028 domain-containing protein [Meiothermus sp.]MDW8217553.1 DUF1028 domain-containing protein [Acidobacteriota bacterium]MCS7057424.1 DUF1028 domain-containing protein [Meiothermus sp.]MCS7193532.1 DUF1028 domain-containing protein [Meiothermus sp.]MCX7739973.1 DUF1028 domain-containing protein [Meiothermus sp.]MDW8090208.1 DUF1028 domain-containing protein [Meiothermus sp.]